MQAYRILSPRITYEILNTEVIAIDFNTGNYYALIHVAKQVWQLIEQQIPLDQIVQLIAHHYQCDSGKVLLDVEEFIRQLLEEGLIEAISAPENVDPAPIVSHGWEYQVPALQKYTDVQNLLLLDPIHEVTEAGWPEQLPSPLS